VKHLRGLIKETVFAFQVKTNLGINTIDNRRRLLAMGSVTQFSRMMTRAPTRRIAVRRPGRLFRLGWLFPVPLLKSAPAGL
jgi:hypothetical protein